MVEHPFFLEVDANYLRYEREREASRDRLTTLALEGGRSFPLRPVLARLGERLASAVNRAARSVAWAAVLVRDRVPA